LRAERSDLKRLHAQTVRRVEAQRARHVDADRRLEAVRQAQEREALWAEWTGSVRFLSRSAMTPKMKSSIIRKYGVSNYKRLPP
jgi:hypothetical protein